MWEARGKQSSFDRLQETQENLWKDDANYALHGCIKHDPEIYETTLQVKEAFDEEMENTQTLEALYEFQGCPTCEGSVRNRYSPATLPPTASIVDEVYNRFADLPHPF